MNETWKDIEGYEDYYQVSNFGRVRRVAGVKDVFSYKAQRMTKRFYPEVILKPSYKPYASVNLSKQNKQQVLMVHRLVAKAFIQNPENKPEVNHIDWDPKNNHVLNLEWCTTQENRYHNSKFNRNKGINSKPVFQFDLTGNFMKEWRSATDASKETGICNGLIGSCASLTNRVKTAGGFIWKFDNTPLTKEEISFRTRQQPRKRKTKQSSAIL